MVGVKAFRRDALQEMLTVAGFADVRDLHEDPRASSSPRVACERGDALRT